MCSNECFLSPQPNLSFNDAKPTIPWHLAPWQRDALFTSFRGLLPSQSSNYLDKHLTREASKDLKQPSCQEQSSCWWDSIFSTSKLHQAPDVVPALVDRITGGAHSDRRIARLQAHIVPTCRSYSQMNRLIHKKLFETLQNHTGITTPICRHFQLLLRHEPLQSIANYAEPFFCPHQ